MCTTHNSQKAGFQEEFLLLIFRPFYSSYTSASHLQYSCLWHTPQHNLAWCNPISSQWYSYHDSRWTKMNSFSRAINTLLNLHLTSKPKLWKPDPFNGSDQHKLWTFILQCKLNFQPKRIYSKMRRTKVNYSLSYPKGLTLDCFKHALLDVVKNGFSNLTEKGWINRKKMFWIHQGKALKRLSWKRRAWTGVVPIGKLAPKET